MCWILKEVGRNTCLGWNSPITIVIKLVSVWRLMKHYKGENVEPQYARMKWENRSLVVWNSLKSQLKRSKLLERLKIVQERQKSYADA